MRRKGKMWGWKAENFRLILGYFIAVLDDEMARSTLSADLEFHILHNYPWAKLPSGIKQVKCCLYLRSFRRGQIKMDVSNLSRYIFVLIFCPSRVLKFKFERIMLTENETPLETSTQQLSILETLGLQNHFSRHSDFWILNCRKL